jgi:hypothetical protein
VHRFVIPPISGGGVQKWLYIVQFGYFCMIPHPISHLNLVGILDTMRFAHHDLIHTPSGSHLYSMQYCRNTMRKVR